jgi:outer membrane protein OmpA-like peptidoglycan-associated protein
VISECGNVSIGRNARLAGAWIEVAAQGGDLTLADGTTLQANASGQVDLEADANLLLDGRITVFAPDVMLTSHDGDIRFGRGTTIVGYGTQDVERLLMQSGRDIDMSQSAVVVATTDVELKADRDIRIGGESRIYSDKSVSITAQNGDIALSGATRIGSSDSDVTRYTDRVALKAGGDVRQDDVDVNRGIVAKELTVSAGGTVTLGAVDQSQTTAAMRKLFLAKGGNIAKSVSVDAGGDIVLALTSPIDSTLTINASRGGTVSGDLIVHGQGNALSFANDLTVQGDASLHGARVTFGRIEGVGLVELSSDQYDTTTTDGLYGGSITARRIVLLTGEGNIDIDALRSTDDLISVARKSLDVEGAIHIDGADSAYTLNVYNGRGGISTAGMRAADVVALFTGDAGVKADASVLQSDTNVVMRIDGADSVAKYLTSDYLSGRDASLIVPGFVPVVSIDQQALDDADKVVDDGDIDALIGYVRDGGFTGELRYDVRDFWTPWMRIKHNVVYFPFDSAALTEAGRAALDRAVETAYEYGISVTFVNVGGYTDRLGADAYNRALADRRAQAVKRYLIDKGVPADRIETSARGKSNAIVECGPTSDVKRCLSPNRRSVIEIEAETPRSKVEPAYSI